MKFLFFFLFISISIKAEEIIIETMGGSEMIFFNLEDKSKISAENTWHLSFKSGNISGTVRSNSNTKVYEALKLGVEEFKNPIEISALSNPSEFKEVHNSNSDWKMGALNQGGAPEEDFNYGWGEYAQGDGIYGTKLFVIEITNQGKKVYFQFVINSVYNNKYYVEWSNLDGSDNKSLEINKATYSDKMFIYLDLVNEELKNIEPVKNNWNLLFTDYVEPLDAGNSIIYYSVSGVMQNQNTWVAELNGDVNSIPNSDLFATEINTIGYDWKRFENTYVIEDRTYFAQEFTLDENQNYVGNGEIYKIRFLDYSGGSEKKSTFDISTIISNVENELYKFVIYPNVISSSESINFINSGYEGNVQVKIISLDGSEVYNQEFYVNTQLNIKTLNLDLSRGFYLVNFFVNNNIYTQKLIIQ